MTKNKNKVYAFTHPEVDRMLKAERIKRYIWTGCLGLALIGTVGALVVK